MMSFIVNGDREVTDDVYRRIAAALLKEADHQRASAAKIDELAGKILADLEK
jgi:hypothetical protein